MGDKISKVLTYKIFAFQKRVSHSSDSEGIYHTWMTQDVRMNG